MIKLVELKNFQSHAHSVLEFHKGMNVIIGQSDSGKTAIIRALRFAIFNKPNGDSFRSNWGGDTSVSIITNGHMIRRNKTNAVNSYCLDETEFKAFGTDVPEEIVKALNMDDTNVQQQLDAPFLLSETPGNVALHFNKVARLDKIDKGLTNVQREINTINKELDHAEKELKLKRTELESFAYLPEMEKDINELTELELKRDEKNNSMMCISILVSAIDRKETASRELKNTVEAEKPINELLELYERKNQIEQDRIKLKKLVYRIQEQNRSIEEAENVIQAEDEITALLKMHEKRSETNQFLTNLRRLYNTITNNQKSEIEQKTQLEAMEREFHDQFPDVCPLCNSKIK